MGVDLGISLFTSAGILLFLSLLAVILRCITRIYIVKAFGLDDWLMIVAMVRTLGLAYLGRSPC
jgi:type IV secretory pathway TrbD component